MDQDPNEILLRGGLRKTPVRLLVLRLLLSHQEALSSHRLEEGLPEVDRVTLYRTLRTFEQKGIIHQAIDGTHSQKFALCTGACTEFHHYDRHAHFHCSACGKTICLDDIPQPLPETPKGFIVHSAHLVLTGSCPDCTFEE